MHTLLVDWPKRLEVRALTEADAREIGDWRYEGPWSVYDSRPEDGPLPVGDPMPVGDDYLAVAGADGGPLVGFCCAGVEARVPGLDEKPGVLDVGFGMDPARVGRGHGNAFGTAVLAHYRAAAGATRLRAVVQSWNERSLRLTRALGFAETGRHVCEQGGRPVSYTVMEISDFPGRPT